MEAIALQPALLRIRKRARAKATINYVPPEYYVCTLAAIGTDWSVGPFSVGSCAGSCVIAMARAGVPVYFAGSSLVLQHFRQGAPGIPLDGTLRESADMLATRHTTLVKDAVDLPRERYRQPPTPSPRRLAATATTKTNRGLAAAVVARSLAAVREVQAFEAAQSVISTRRSVETAARTAALAAEKARARRVEAAARRHVPALPLRADPASPSSSSWWGTGSATRTASTTAWACTSPTSSW
jgi:hypothetical protein